MCQTSHTCERDKCPPKNVSGPTVRCVKCHRTFYLFCFGFSKCGANGVKINSPFNSNVGLDPKSIKFTCGKCDAVFLNDEIDYLMEAVSPNHLSTNQMTSASVASPNSFASKNDFQSNASNSTVNSNNPVSNAELKKDLMTLNSMVKSVKQSLSVHSTDLTSIKQISTDIYQKVNHPIQNLSINTPVEAQTPIEQQPFSFAQIINEQRTANRLSGGMKRTASAINSPAEEKPKNLPPPKMGTRSIQSNLKIAPPSVPKSKLDRSVHVSRIDKSVSTEMIIEYITQNSQLKPTDDFKCTLLVKKDTDVNTLSFVSYKIDVKSEHFSQLIDVNFWPQGAFIREFISQDRKKSTFSDFVSHKPLNQPNKMQKVNETDEKNVPTSSNVTTNSTSSIQTDSLNEKLLIDVESMEYTEPLNLSIET